jgi:hypothetical protein
VIHVVAREEIEPPRRILVVADPEQPSVRRLLVETTRRDYSRAFAEWRDGMARRWRAAGANYVQVTTDEDSSRAVRRVVESPAGARVR